MFLLFYKETEDEKTVSYFIETNIYEKPSIGVVKTKVKALCIFDKITKKNVI